MATNSLLPTCVIGGTLLSLVVNISSTDVVKTVILAVLGAVVSFFVSLLLKYTIRKRNKH